MAANRILNIELKEFAAASLTGSFQDFGTALSNPAIKVVIQNTSAVDAYITKDNSTNWIRIVGGGSITLDESTLYNAQKDDAYYLPVGAQLRIKQVTGAGASGTNIVAHIVTRNLP